MARYRRRPSSRSEAEVPQRDFPLIRQRLLEKSESNTYEEARTEWEFTKTVYEGEPDFTDQCELCNAVGLRTNYLIVNKYTHNTFLVGSHCITRFIRLGGALTQEESNEIFEAARRKQEAAQVLQRLLPAILTQPTPGELLDFRNYSKKILGSLDNRSITNWKPYLEMLLGPRQTSEQVAKIRTALFEPARVRVIKPAMPTGTGEGHWATAIKAKRARVRTSLARSGAYRVGTSEKPESDK